jgi:hypothetical protein
VDAVNIGGGGGNIEGVGNNSGKGVLPTKEANEDKDKTTQNVANNPKNEELEKPKPPTPDLGLTKDEAVRPADTSASDSRLLGVGEKLREKIAGAIAGKGQGGPGKGGGKGSGEGKGEGNLTGDGTGKLNQREKRQLRWTMIFNTHSGEDYADQLKGLGAILAIPGPNGEYLVIRNPDRRRRPVQTTKEDLKELNRIYWVDDKPESVASLSRALGIHPVPDHIVAFFPKSLEDDLLDRELKAFRGKEEDILETVFKVTRMPGAGYMPIVERQTRK